MFFQEYRLRKTWLGKFLKGRVSEDPSTDNMANGLKQCCSLNGSTISIFINHCRCICVKKRLF